MSVVDVTKEVIWDIFFACIHALTKCMPSIKASPLSFLNLDAFDPPSR
jgi:hypothetical protein